MLGSLKNKIKYFLMSLLRNEFETYKGEMSCSPFLKVSQAHLYNYFKSQFEIGTKVNLEDVGYRVYSQVDEDGKIMCIFAAIGMGGKTFIDIGSGDCINSNCANLAINFGWHGLFIDGQEGNINKGKNFYTNHPDTFLYPPKFSNSFVQCENINSLIEENGFQGEIDLLSIDIDGNDYWVWDAIDIVDPRVVIIETHVEFGTNSIVVPYNKDFSYPGKHPDYFGASPVAMQKLAHKKGYRLVASNIYGFNTIYVKESLCDERLPEYSVEKVLSHPRNVNNHKIFEPIKDWEYVVV